MDLKGKKVLVVGLGKTGEALCDFLLRRGALVSVSEKKRPEMLADKIRFWTEKGVTVEAGGHRLSSFLEAELIVTSPGVPMLPEYEEVARRGIPLISEIELAYRFLRGTIVGITGSNGKSTTTTLTHIILRDAGHRAFLAGNIDTPLIQFIEESHEGDIYVTELSSFQLEHSEDFHVEVAVFLNVSPDHLDRHQSFEAYFTAKKKLITALEPEGVAVLNRDDPLVWGLQEKANFRVYGFSRKDRVSRGCYLQDGRIVLSDNGAQKLLSVADIQLFGVHNQENVMASCLVGHAFGVMPESMSKSVRSFKGLEHRLERIIGLKGIDFYNDSKATNVGAALQSIESFNRPVILILGGRDKGGDFTKLKQSVLRRVKRIFLIGEAKEKIRKALDSTVPMTDVASLHEAVESGFAGAESGDVVLLAPACTSFDMFENFEERGRAFKQEVFLLRDRVEKS